MASNTHSTTTAEDNTDYIQVPKMKEVTSKMMRCGFKHAPTTTAENKLKLNGYAKYGQQPKKRKVVHTISKHNYNTCIHTKNTILNKKLHTISICNQLY